MYHRLQKIDNQDGSVTLFGPCFITGKQYSVTVQNEELQMYQNGALAQDAFPHLSKDDREFLISGTSPEGWNQTFGN